MKILVTIPQDERMESFVPSEVQARLEQIGEVFYNETMVDFTKEELRNLLMDKDVVITGWGTSCIDSDVLEGNTTLKVIAHTGGSVAAVCDNATYEKGVCVLSGNELYAESVAEAVIAYALTVLRKIPDYLTLTRQGGWNEEIPVWEGLLEKRVGLIGYGATARHLVPMLKLFRCEILVYDPFVSDEELKDNGITPAGMEEIFSSCHIVSLHASLNKSTYHMIDRRLLELLRQDALFINTARGAIVDEQDLTELLTEGKFRAILDVFEQEPLPLSHKLRNLPNVYVLPHRAGPTYDRRKVVTLTLIEDIENFFAGRPVRLAISKKYAGQMTRERIV